MSTPSAEVSNISYTLYSTPLFPPATDKCDLTVEKQVKPALNIIFCRTLSIYHDLIRNLAEAVNIRNLSSCFGISLTNKRGLVVKGAAGLPEDEILMKSLFEL